MPEDVPPPDEATETDLRPAPRAARERLLRFNTAVLTRLNLGGLLTVAATACAIDFASSGDVLWGTILTGIQILLVAPWAYAVLALDRTEARIARRASATALWRRAVHALGFGAVAATLVAKAALLHQSQIEDFLPATGAYRQYTLFYFTLFVLGLVGRGSRAERFLATVADHPARLMTISFGVAAVFGGFLLTLPVSLRDVESASFVDGLFTSVSAVCVTGLVVNDVASTYTLFGQFVLLVLMQAGGLGIMVLTAFFAIVAGRRLRVRSSVVLAEMIDADSMAALRRTLRNIVVYTFAIEAAGAAVLYLAFLGHPEVDLGPESASPAAGAGGALWSAVFHSVSAFCNAGFSLCHGNLLPFVGSWWVCGTVAVLVTLGGFGFPVLSEIAARVRNRLATHATPKFSLHARVVLLTSAVLVAAGTLAFLVLERNATLAPLSALERLLASLFQSVTARTAGFNTIDFGAIVPATLVVICFLMFVGASPGSTGGGIKTTTFAVLLAAFRGEIRGHDAPRLLDRTIPAASVRRALGVAVVSLVFQIAVMFALLLTEGDLLARYRDDALGPLRIVFEVMSAFATCGLSTGITAQLSVTGKLLVAATMLVGRIGPLTVALAATAPPRSEPFTRPEERVMIG